MVLGAKQPIVTPNLHSTTIKYIHCSPVKGVNVLPTCLLSRQITDCLQGIKRILLTAHFGMMWFPVDIATKQIRWNDWVKHLSFFVALCYVGFVGHGCQRFGDCS